ncbi:hypothetical protein [Salsuginibacillus kocurii]|uniref:hypothetical protein n=1 Tax=Salsuginibacillus kocurii TaxID=427078 RepID=UPI0003612800|nr:hypothetical protein [Salsuginibacillus kocurii]
MFIFPEWKNVRFVKLAFHFVLFTMIFTFMVEFGSDLTTWLLGYHLESSGTIIMMLSLVWLLYAMQRPGYQKEETGTYS